MWTNERHHAHRCGHRHGNEEPYSEYAGDGRPVIAPPILGGQNRQRRGKPEVDDVQDELHLPRQRGRREDRLVHPAEHKHICHADGRGDEVLEYNWQKQRKKLVIKAAACTDKFLDHSGRGIVIV